MKSSSKEKARRASKKPMHSYFFDSLNGWMGGGMWLWTVIGVAVVVLLVVVIGKLFKK